MKNMQRSIQISSKIPFEIHLKNDVGKYWTIKNNSNNNNTTSIVFWGPMLERVAWFVPGVARFFLTFFLFGTFAGTPRGWFWTPFGPTYLPTSLLPFFFSSWIPSFRTSNPPGGRFTSPPLPKRVGHILLGYYVFAQSARSLRSSRYVRKKGISQHTLNI